MTELRQRDPRERNSLYMGWIAKLPCPACLRTKGRMNREVQVAHLRIGSPEHGKRPTGMQERPSDAPWVLPLCPAHHQGDKHRAKISQDVGAGGERGFWFDYLGIDPFALCIELHDAYEAGKPTAAGVNIISRAVGQARRNASC